MGESTEPNGSESKIAEAQRILSQLSDDEREKAIQPYTEERHPPLVGWASNPLKVKASLKHVRNVGSCTRRELADYLNTIDALGAVESLDFGVATRKSNDLFHIEKKWSKEGDVFSLTPQGEIVESMFNDDLSGLTPVEKALYRGLHSYESWFVFLGEIVRYQQQPDAHKDGILKRDLIDRLKEPYGNESEAYVGFYATLSARLDLMKRTRDGNQMRYQLLVPREWD